MNNFAQSIIILNRRKKQVLDELNEAKYNLLIWSKRVESSKENNKFDLLKEASIYEDLYLNKVKSLESQLSQLSAEIEKYEQKQSKSILHDIYKASQLSELKKEKKEETEENNGINDDFTKEEELNIEEEIKLIKNYLKCATNALEKLESKVLRRKQNKEIFDITNIDDELEELRKQLRE